MLPNLFVHGFSYLVGDATLEDFVPFIDARKLRRAEPISKNVLLCAFRAFEQAQMLPIAKTDCGISLALGAGALSSTLKFMDTIIENGDELSSPTAFASSVHNSTALMLSLFLGIQGACVLTGQLDSSFVAALVNAQQFLAQKRCEQVLLALTEDINPLISQTVAKNSHAFDPFVYQASLPATRVAVALVLGATPTNTTSFSLKNIRFSRTDDIHTHTKEELDICTCAHSALGLVKQLEQRKSFVWREQFTGTIFEIKGEKYVHTR